MGWGYPYPSADCGCCAPGGSRGCLTPINASSPCLVSGGTSIVWKRDLVIEADTGSGLVGGFADWYNVFKAYQGASTIGDVRGADAYLMDLTYQGITAEEPQGYWEGSTSSPPGEAGFGDTWNIRFRPKIWPPAPSGGIENPNRACGEHWLSSNPTDIHAIDGSTTPYAFESICSVVPRDGLGATDCNRVGNLIGKGFPKFLLSACGQWEFTLSGVTNSVGASQDGTFVAVRGMNSTNVSSAPCNQAPKFSVVATSIDTTCPSFPAHTGAIVILTQTGCIFDLADSIYRLSTIQAPQIFAVNASGVGTTLAFEPNGSFLTAMYNWGTTVQYVKQAGFVTPPGWTIPNTCLTGRFLSF